MQGAGNGEYRKGLWTEEEDRILTDHVKVHGKGKWNQIAKVTGTWDFSFESLPIEGNASFN